MTKPDYLNELKDLKSKSIIRFSLKGKERYAKVVSIYDGDTCDLAFCVHDKVNSLVRYKCRMSGYDAPELDEPNGEVARNFLAYLCLQIREDFDPLSRITTDELQKILDRSRKLVFAKFGREGKYGRPVVTLHPTSPNANNICEEMTINNMMKDYLQTLDKKPTE